MNIPRFSVIIPTCHRNDLLAKCLDCLAPGKQTLGAEHYEVIVSDDGLRSTAQEMVKEKYPWARWNQGPRKGPAANRNSGANQANGKWLVFTDDDCLPHPEWLKNYSQSICDGFWVYEGKTTCSTGISSPLQHAPINLFGGYLWSCNLMVCADVFKKVSGFNDKFPLPHMEDVDFSKRVQEVSRCRFVSDAMVDHPPRRVAFGNFLAKQHESHYYYYTIVLGRDFSAVGLFSKIIRTRLKSILRHKPSLHSVAASASLVVELIVTSSLLYSWKRKYRS